MIWILYGLLIAVAAACWFALSQLAQAFRDADEWQREETW